MKKVWGMICIVLWTFLMYRAWHYLGVCLILVGSGWLDLVAVFAGQILFTYFGISIIIGLLEVEEEKEALTAAMREYRKLYFMRKWVYGPLRRLGFYRDRGEKR